MEVYLYMKGNTILKNTFIWAYPLVMGQYPKLLKRRLNNITGWIQASTTFDILELVMLSRSILFKFEDLKYLHLSPHQAKMKFYTLHEGNMSN